MSRNNTKDLSSVVRIDDGYYSLVTLSYPLCMTCQFPIGEIEREYHRRMQVSNEKTGKGGKRKRKEYREKSHREILAELGVTRPCCSMYLTFRNEYPMVIDTQRRFENFKPGEIKEVERFYPSA